MTTRIQVRRDTAANWTSSNPILAAGEMGYETDTNKLKVGDGSTTWTSLAYSPNLSSNTLTTPTISGATFSAGTNTVPPIKLTSGVNLTSSTAGAIEYDGNAFYGSVNASERGVIPTEQLIVLTSTNTLTSQTGVQPIFDGGGGPAGGQITLSVGTYRFECMFSLTSMSATSGSFGFDLGGTATKTYTYMTIATDAALATASNTQTTFNTAANTALCTASTSTTGYAYIRGLIRITVAGTIIPQVSLTTAAAAVVGTNSYFYVNQIGNATVATVGNWS